MDMCSTISSTVSAGRLMRSLHAAVKVAGDPAKLVSILFLYDESRKSLVYHSSADEYKDRPANLSRHDLRFELVTDSAVRQICLRGRPELINRRHVDHSSRQLLERLDTNELLLAPMISRGKLYGLMALDCSGTDKMAETVSSQCFQALVYLGAVALERIHFEEKQENRPNIQIDFSPDKGAGGANSSQVNGSSIADSLAESLIDDCRNTLDLSKSLLELAADERNLADRQNCLMSLGAIFRQFRERIERASQVLECSSASDWFCFASVVEQAATLAREMASNDRIPIEVSVPDDRKMFYGAGQLLSLGLSQLIKTLTRTSNEIIGLQIRVESEEQKFRIRIYCRLHGDQPKSAVRKILSRLVQCHYDRLVAESMALCLIERAGGKFEVVADNYDAIVINIEFLVHAKSNIGKSESVLTPTRWSENVTTVSEGTR